MTYAVPHSYDDVSYPGHTYPESHPAHLATIATLLGLAPPAVDSCRVLELGCAEGNNLITIAADLPNSICIGVDVSAQQIKVAQQRAAVFEVRNVTFAAVDLCDIDADFGQFDYIIAHGLFSWVPPQVQEHILAICKQNLAPNGIVYISYNTYPGWHIAETLRNLLLYRLRDVTDPHDRALKAFELLDFLTSAGGENFAYDNSIAVYAGMFKRKLDTLGSYREAFLLHDLLEEVNAPIYFHQFAARAETHGLQYLAEAIFPHVLPREFTPQVTEQLQLLSGSVVDLEQYMDALRNRMFRQTLLCHTELPLRRALRPEHVMDLHVSVRAVPVSAELNIDSAHPEAFRGSDGATITLDDPVSKGAMAHLATIWPAPLAFDELLTAAYGRLDHVPTNPAQDAYLLAANLLKAYCYSATLVVLRVAPVAVTSRISEHPRVRSLARLQAQQGSEVTNAYHESIKLDPICLALLPLLDGTRDQAALVAALVAQVTDGRLRLALPDGNPPSASELEFLLQAEVAGNLRWLANAALLTEDSIDGGSTPTV